MKLSFFRFSILRAFFTVCGLSFSIFNSLSGQELKAGFDPNEFAEMLRITARQRGPIPDSLFPQPLRFKLNYSSGSMGMDNGWQLWTNDEKQAVISVRATTKKTTSWLENFYCAMVKAEGTLRLEDDFVWNYKLCDFPDATVHAGWLVGTGFLQRDIRPRIDSLYAKGFRDFIINGHSQGGAISFLLTAYLRTLQKDGEIPSDIRFKTYSSAAPKPGNLDFAYAYENMTKDGWAYTVVNSEDWVPKAPMSLQTISDFGEVNPFSNFKDITKKLHFFERTYLRSEFKKLQRSFDYSDRKMNKLMGYRLSGLVKKVIPEFMPPNQYYDNNYQRAGLCISLITNEAYFKIYPPEKHEYFRHHLMNAYEFLLETHYKDQMSPEYILYLKD